MSDRRRTLERAGLRARLIGMVVGVTALSVLLLGITALSAFDRAIEPELANRTRLIGAIIRAEIQRAVDLGIPFDSLTGLDSYLSETLTEFGEVDRIVVTTETGQVIATAERQVAPSLLEEAGLGEVIAFDRPPSILPILRGNDVVGEITIETNPLFVQTRLRDVFLDVMVIALVAMLIALELALAVAIASVGKPLERVFRLLGEQREGDFRHCIRRGGLSGLGRVAARLNDRAEDLAGRLAALPEVARSAVSRVVDAKIAVNSPLRLRLSDFNDIRLALFLFSVATEIAAAFLPVHARTVARPGWLSPEMAAAAPLALYLVGVAALSPFGGTLARRFGPRRLFLASVPPTVLALAAMGISENLVQITVWRGVTAVFYATATIACQEYAIRAAGERASARASGAFVAVVYGGVFCGSAMGGVTAGRFGVEAAFYVGAVIATLSGLLAIGAMRGRAGDPIDEAGRSESVRSGLPGFRTVVLLLGVTVPMNAATAILVWFLVPLLLAGDGSGPAEIARVVMLYYLAVVLFGPSVSRLSDGRAGPSLLIALGAFTSGLSLLSLTLWSGYWAIVVAVAGLGLGHTLIRTPQYALALAMTGGTGAGLGSLRVVERIGALLGLVASALVLRESGAEPSVMVLGLAVLTGAAAFAMLEVIYRLGRARTV